MIYGYETENKDSSVIENNFVEEGFIDDTEALSFTICLNVYLTMHDLMKDKASKNKIMKINAWDRLMTIPR